jgi:hypothetical protein
MLREYENVRQIPGEAKRRWFFDDYFDLIVWVHANDVLGFQLCYDILKTHRALTWHQDTGFSHHRIDDGESRPGHMKASPILMPDGKFDYETIAQRFKLASPHVDEHIATFVFEKLMEYPL